MSTRRGQLQEGKDGLPQVIRLLNELLRNQPPAGVAFFPAAETLPAFYCVGNDDETDAAILAKSTSSPQVLATGVTRQAANVGETAVMVQRGRIDGAVSGRAANDQVWVGTTGALVFAAPAGYTQVIATCINATDIYVNPQTPVF